MAVSPDPTPIMALKEHFVHFYESDRSLYNSMNTFIGEGLRAGDTCIVISTREHYERFQERLKENDPDGIAVWKQGACIWLDAAEMLAQFMVDGLPERERFMAVVGSVIAQTEKDQCHVRVFGEMVALLWMQGNQAAAICLEELWNDLHHQGYTFSLLCGYPMHSFDGQAYGTPFLEICRQHSHIIPVEHDNLLAQPDEQVRAVTLLQQKANSLALEIAQREEVEQRLAAIVESSDDAIVSKNLDGIIRSWNAAAERLFGYSAAEAVGKHITLIIPPELYHEEEEIIKKLRQGIRIQHFETVRLKKDGTLIEVSLSISPVKDRTGKIVGAAKIARDISERRELERRKDAFISMASHELKTPVTALKGFTQVLHRRFKKRNDEESLRLLARMDAQINKQTRLISEMLDLSKMKTGQLAYRMEPFDLAELVEEIVEQVQGTTSIHHLLLEETVTAQLYGDRDRIGQVLMNLLTNAIKYSRDADSVIVRMAIREGNVEVSVQDFGIGIAPMYREKIFERFYQVAETGEQTYPGLGIGLYIASEIVRRHEGSITVESEKGKGSTFRVSFPLKEG